MEVLHELLLLTLLIALAVGMLRLTNLLAIAIMTGVYSLILAVVYVLMDAVDVAFTEAAVGAGVTLALMLAAISMTTREEKRRSAKGPAALPLLAAVITGMALVYAVSGMPGFGDPTAPIHTHVAPRYIEVSPHEIGIPNMVTSVLASYRGFDTLGEVAVIFTAGVSVVALLWRWNRDD